MPNKRSRNDIHPGDAVRVEHSQQYGLCIAEEGPEPEDKITVRLKGGEEWSAVRRLFVPVIDRKDSE